MTYVALVYVHPPSRWWGAALPDMRWAYVAALVTVLAVAVRRVEPSQIPLQSFRFTQGYVLFLLWISVQFLWALDAGLHWALFEQSLKYGVVMVLIYKCVDSERHLRYFLWTHVFGCVYWGWIAHAEYLGGRFQGFGGPAVSETNMAAMQLATGLFVAGALLLCSQTRVKAIVLVIIPFILNAFVTTISRSGFLGLGFGGLVFNLLAPQRLKGSIRLSSVLAVVLLGMLSTAVYWSRMESMRQAGQEIEGEETGRGRIELMRAQIKMFEAYPLGCGHRCTLVLAPSYLEAEWLAGATGEKGRSSHNTFMSLLVEQGFVGAIFYVLLMYWLCVTIVRLARNLRGSTSLVAIALPAVGASLGAIAIGDMFVDYVKSETRLWFVALLMVLVNLTAKARSDTGSEVSVEVSAINHAAR